LEEALRGLAGVPGRKLVVLVSDGFLLGSGTADSHRIDLRALTDLATRSRTSVFALQARGLLAFPTGGDASRPASLVQTLPGLQERYEKEEDLALREGMGDLAESTGGFLVQGTNDLSAAMRRILDVNAKGYLLAYEPAQAGDGRFRRIEVKLPRHPELRVHARRGYFSADERAPGAGLSVAGQPSPPRKRDAAVRLALASLVPLHDVPLELSADFLDSPAEGLRLVIRAHVDLARLAFEVVGGRQEADLEFVSVVYAENGGVAAEAEGQRAEMRLSPANHERLMREGLGYQRSVAVKPGSYQVRVVVRDERSGRLGSAWRWVEVPDLGAGALALSDVVLFAESGPGGAEASRPGLRDVQVRRRYAPGANLYYVAYAYNPRRDPQGGVDVVAQAQVWAADRPQGASPAEPLTFEGRTASASGRIALEGLGAGEYELRLIVVDRKAQATVQKRVTFSVE
ncbi:MAG TPA: VWA domain-containing protein, partial [Vicinamibacteria bacterium]|nr:VWA domain-containing protein [Vicinamibacteria bacterium]